MIQCPMCSLSDQPPTPDTTPDIVDENVPHGDGMCSRLHGHIAH